MSERIKVYNRSERNMDVAISFWGSGGSREFYPIDKQENGSWSRSNTLGFIMVITERGASRTDGTYWYVKANTDIYINSLTDVDGALAGLPNPFDN